MGLQRHTIEARVAHHEVSHRVVMGLEAVHVKLLATVKLLPLRV